MKWIKNDGGRLESFPEHYKKKDSRIGDCVIRAISIATQQDYKKVWGDLFELGKEMGFMPNNEQTYVKYLADNGWNEIKFGKKLVRLSFSEVTEMSKDRFIVCHTAGHLVAMKDGDIYDTYDSRKNSMDDYDRVFRIYYKNI